MDITVCMVVKDEERHVEACVAPLRDAFADFVVVDTGSTDRTCEILRDRFGIAALQVALNSDAPFSLTATRNESYGRVKTPWILCIDADERLTADDARRLAVMPDDPGARGYFMHWRTEADGETPVEDYKLSLFRREARKAGMVHESAQPDFRARQWAAGWLDGVTLRHLPDVSRRDSKRALYLDALRAAAEADPAWLRYHWFVGHDLFQLRRLDEARPWLERCFDGRSWRFPVESLNAAMLLASIAALQDDAGRAARIVASALLFHETVRDDFEVRVNFRLRAWLEAALAAIRDGRLDRLVPYAFPY